MTGSRVSALASTPLRTTWMLVAIVAALAAAGCDLFVDPGTRIMRAERLMAAASYPTAIIELRKALRDRPNDAHAHLLLARAALQVGDAGGAMEELKRATELGTPPAATADLQARIEIALGQFEAVLTQIDGGQLRLQEPARSIYRGEALHGLKRDGKAVEAYMQALAADSSSEEAGAGLAQAYAALGQFDRALGQLDALTSRHPEFARAWVLRGSVLAMRGQFGQADAALHEALRHAAGQLTLVERAGLLVTLAETRLARGDVEGASQAQRQLADVAPDSVMTHFVLARVEAARQDYPDAITELQSLLAGAPGYLPARFLLGSLQIQQGSPEQGELELAQVVRDAPANLEARKLLAQVRLRLGRPDAAMRVLLPAVEATPADRQLRALIDAAESQLRADPANLGLLEDAVAAHPGDDGLKVSLASAYLANGREDKAIDVLNRTTGQSRLALAWLYLREKQPAKADAVVNQLLAATPDRASLLNLAGLLYLQASHYEQALAHLRAAADREPGNGGYWVNVAQAQLALHQPLAARESIDKALAIRADWPPAVAIAAMLDLGAGQTNAAVARVVALEKAHPGEATVLLLEGDVRVAAKQYAAAEAAYEEAGRLHPTAIAALRSYSARRLAGIADPAKPLRDWLSREPDDLRVRRVLAEAEQEREPAQAIADYQRILARAPNDPEILNNLAWLYQQTGDGRALATASKAHQLAPEVAAIADTYGWILLQHGEVAEALPILKAAAAHGDPQIAAHYEEARRRASAQRLGALQGG